MLIKIKIDTEADLEIQKSKLQLSNQTKKVHQELPKTKDKSTKGGQILTVPATKKEVINLRKAFEKIVSQIIESIIKDDKHPFVRDCVVENNELVCKGNFTLLNLNLSYNNITSSACQKIVKMLLYQQDIGKGNAGLTNILLEGNPAQETCNEINYINCFKQDMQLLNYSRDSLYSKSPTMCSKFYVFVYGTLKTDEPNHYWFEKNPNGSYEFISNAETTEKYPLIVATKYNIPFLLYKPGIGHYIKGELYAVNEDVLANLDLLEEHPTFYVREKYLVKRLDSQETVEAWIYFIKKFRLDLLELPLLENYRNKDQETPYSIKDESSLDDLQ
ncbi:hypothetical protein RN001_000938 [Aquatica leii]|uniref:Gamma-glutamylcyclotransferase family protein n=1 Tax=Aquatica leii TaxID=1421715 RepID=A0AAN7PFK3_9COLE|nr:hypothetical protein RN001_000938 [Aquatica leii]